MYLKFRIAISLGIELCEHQCICEVANSFIRKSEVETKL